VEHVGHHLVPAARTGPREGEKKKRKKEKGGLVETISNLLLLESTPF